MISAFDIEGLVYNSNLTVNENIDWYKYIQEVRYDMAVRDATSYA
jgi:hypothetical protein